MTEELFPFLPFDVPPPLTISYQKNGTLVLSCPDYGYLREVCHIATEMAATHPHSVIVALGRNRKKVSRDDRACDLLQDIRQKLDRRQMKALRDSLHNIQPSLLALHSEAICGTPSCHELTEQEPPRKGPRAAHGGAVRYRWPTLVPQGGE